MIKVQYLTSDFLFAFMFFRCYFLVKTIMNYTEYMELYSKKVCHKYGFTVTTSFCIKAMMLKKPGKTVFFTAIFSILWLSYILRVFERLYYNECGQILFDHYFTSIWCVIITMTTVGYGDVFAVSTIGRCVSIVNALWGAFVIGLLVSSIQDLKELSDNQKKAVAEITNSKKAAQSVSAGITYFC